MSLRRIGAWIALLWLSAGSSTPGQTRPIVIPPIESPRPSVSADRSARSSDPPSNLKTTVEFEILSGNPSAGLDAHRWAEALQKFGVTVQVRTPKLADELGVTEKVRGTLRWVTATGQLAAGGKLAFPDRSFTLSQSTQLKEWIDELKLYGAQGAPEGKPLWGLTADQFGLAFQSLSTPTIKGVEKLSLHEALRALPVPTDMPIRLHSTAARHLSTRRTAAQIRTDVAGLSVGTALAAVLADQGLAFRPLRTPTGSIELVVEPLASLKQPWPIGWEFPKEASRHQLASGLFKMVPVGFTDVPLSDVLGAVAEVAAVPVVVNHDSAGRRGVDLKKTLVSYPKKKTAYIVVLNSVVRSHRLTHELRVDERGRPFVYVTAFVPKLIEDLSPAESR